MSLASGACVTAALRGACRVEQTEWRGSLSPALLDSMRLADAVFLALHGGDGEDGRLQRRLEAHGIFHYTGSPPAGAALAMRKDLAKAAVARCGVPVPKGCVLSVGTPCPLPLPVVLKPRDGGSSIGLRFLHTEAEWQALPPCCFAGDTLCEELLTGREYTVGILAGEALPVVEIRPLDGPYDYEHKYRPGASLELCPAPLPHARAAALQQAALTAFAALGLRDYARMDFRESSAGEPYFLEANTLPGMTATSLLPLAASVAGYDKTALCLRMAELAAKRKTRSL